eukprot:15223426-Ditylum_brightwellii.AAC.1
MDNRARSHGATELSHLVHLCARFCKAPNASHERDVNHISRHWLTTQPMDGKESLKYRQKCMWRHHLLETGTSAG